MFRFSVETKSFFLLQSVETDSWAKPASWSVDTGGHCLGGKDVGGQHDHSPLSNAELNPLNAELNPFSHLLALLGAHHILQVSRVRAKNKQSYTSAPSWHPQGQCYLYIVFYYGEPCANHDH